MNKNLRHSSNDNTWEPEENLGCPDLIAAFEKAQKEKAARSASVTSASTTAAAAVVAKRNSDLEIPSKKKHRAESSSSSILNTTNSENQPPSSVDTAATEPNMTRGFDRGLVPEKIIGATDSSGELMFLMKWKNSDEADLVLAKQANLKCPQVVIAFYEERLTWNTSVESQNDENRICADS